MPGDEILVPRPSYPLFQFLADMESVRVRQYSLWYHGSWSIDRRSVERALSPRTRAIVLVNPNNPTGSYVKRGELAGLTALCAQRDIALISDEVFADYSLSEDDDRVTTLAAVEECLAFSMSGLSKVAGLPQMKLGWIVVNGPRRATREGVRKPGVGRGHLPLRQHAGAVRRRAPAGRGRYRAAADPRALGGQSGLRARRAGRLCGQYPERGRRLVHHPAGAANPQAKRSGRSNYWSAPTCWCNPGTSTISKPKPTS